MQIILSLVSLAALIGAILGLIKPDLALFFLPSEKQTRFKAFGLYIGLLIVCILILPTTEQAPDEPISTLETKNVQVEKQNEISKVEISKISSEQILAAREAVRSLLNQLIKFKGDNVFHEKGFGEGNPLAHKWMKAVNAASSRISFQKGYPIELAASPAYLLELGMEYMRTKGKENNSTRIFRQYVDEGLTPPPAPVAAVAPSGSKERLGKWESTWGYNHTKEIVRQGGAATIKSTYGDGSSGIEQYIAEDKDGQIKLTRVGDVFGEYYIINKRGELEYWSKTENYYIAPKM